MSGQPSFLDEIANEGRLEEEIREFISSHSRGSVFTIYRGGGVGEAPATDGFFEDLYNKASSETRNKALKVGAGIFDEILVSYVAGDKVDFEAFDVFIKSFGNDLPADIGKLIRAINITDKDFKHITKWYAPKEIDIQTTFLNFLPYNQNQASGEQKKQIESIYSTIWESYPKTIDYAGQRLSAFLGIIGLNPERVSELYPQMIEERKEYLQEMNFSPIDYGLISMGLPQKYWPILASRPEEITRMDKTIKEQSGR